MFHDAIGFHRCCYRAGQLVQAGVEPAPHSVRASHAYGRVDRAHQQVCAWGDVEPEKWEDEHVGSEIDHEADRDVDDRFDE